MVPRRAATAVTPTARPRLGEGCGKAYAEPMNRQFRRAQEKQDKKQEKEKARRREERKSRLRELRRSRNSGQSKRESTSDDKEPRPRGRLPGRFAGVLAAVTVFFITLQGVAPVEEDQGLAESMIGAGFYLMLGYFATLWFMRRQVGRPLVVTVAGGALLAASVTITAAVQGREVDPLALALILPALIAGAFLGRLVFVASPR